MSERGGESTIEPEVFSQYESTSAIASELELGIRILNPRCESRGEDKANVDRCPHCGTLLQADSVQAANNRPDETYAVEREEVWTTSIALTPLANTSMRDGLTVFFPT